MQTNGAAQRAHIYCSYNVLPCLQLQQKYVAKRTIYYQEDRKQSILFRLPCSQSCIVGDSPPAFLTSPTLSDGIGEESSGKKKKNFCFGCNIVAMIV